MKSTTRHRYGLFIIAILMQICAYASELEQDLKGVASPTDGYIKPVQFIVSLYRENGDTRPSDAKEKSSKTESMRIADGQAAFIGSSTEVPIPVVTAGRADDKASLKAVAYKKIESGVELRPHLMGRFVQLEIVQKEETWNDKTNSINTNKTRSVVVIPLDEWSKVIGSLNDNIDIEDIYETNRKTGENIWVKASLALN